MIRSKETATLVVVDLISPRLRPPNLSLADAERKTLGTTMPRAMMELARGAKQLRSPSSCLATTKDSTPALQQHHDRENTVRLYPVTEQPEHKQTNMDMEFPNTGMLNEGAWLSWLGTLG